MSRLRRYPFFTAALTGCGFLALGGVWCVYDRYAAAKEAEAKLEQRKAELHALAALTPSPTPAIAAAIEADLHRVQRALAAIQSELIDRGSAGARMRTAKIPATRTDAFFDLAAFVEKTRELARKHAVEIRPEVARFGFALYANEGPREDRLAVVFRQRWVAQYLLETLFEARPRALLAFQRERALTVAERAARDATVIGDASTEQPPGTLAEGEPDGPDFFELDPRVSVRAAGYLNTTAFRVSFTGETSTLRTFLNRLASFELPVLVHEVEVAPATMEEAERSGPEAAAAANEPDANATSVVLTVDESPPKQRRAAAALPIVSKPLTTFTVTMEYIEPASTKTTAEPKPSE